MASSSSSNVQKIEATSSIAMEQLQHFSHEHELSLVQLRQDHNNVNSDTENEEEDKDDIVQEDCRFGECKMCKEEIYSFQLCYYTCKDCDYSLHKFCAQLPTTLQNHPLHPGHNLTLSEEPQYQDSDFYGDKIVHGVWGCDICRITWNRFYNYHCSICNFVMDIICASMSEHKMDHPCHPHQLERYFLPLKSVCYACNGEHTGTFYHCTTCSRFMIHLSCALLPAKLLIQQSTNENFSHPHLLTLAYSFPYNERKAKFFPRCRVCDKLVSSANWHYRCDKCRYYVHADCATSPRDAFMSSILMPAGFGKIYKNYKDDDLPNLIHCPFPDESVNLLMHLFINKGELVTNRKIDYELFYHPHPLILFDTRLNESVSFLDPMKKVELLCDGCVKPITNVPFYKCSQHHCEFVLHEWCTCLLKYKTTTTIQSIHIFSCQRSLESCWVCLFVRFAAYLAMVSHGCKKCEYYVDTICGFIPNVITHEAHPNHLLLRVKVSWVKKYCNACRWWIPSVGFQCPTCDFYLHTKCALLIPRTIKHRYDKHPLILRYNPVVDYISEYFCDICEDEFNPIEWFYHCNTCTSFMHTSCASLKFQCEQSTYYWYQDSIFNFINVKFGGTIKIGNHEHLVQGINADGQCIQCGTDLQYEMIFKCFQCKFALHYWCESRRIQEIPDTSI